MPEESAEKSAAAEVLGAAGEADEIAPEPPKPEPLSPEVLGIHLRAAAAFQVFDHEGTNMVDVRELGAIIRSLGLCPTEAELNTMTMECEDEEESGIVRYNKFEPMVTRVMLSNRFRSEAEEDLLKAFQVLDAEGQGFLTEEDLTKILLEEGEPFKQEEVEEMMVQAKALDRDVIVYDEHIPLLHVPTKI
mmetsp:Transcript_35678/g.93261  ORF Transcript_35678/g.93261 Transcript_35678/m.93261 type:complete len:190 (+) Transcript_35678:41-610(+)